ncbi:hypothetical protein C446_10580 [Halobiforma nitratireducens JCM 10879]|uniref:Uncharacterized protein n=1 Tax=Halobiforma nitratireducens JCM 10879 TaxID=1227454 RepID=M0M0F9_9EURY|nr:hypothetical protein [Halobiforma nitratireducens]EMA37865.1 hypothetical protein C446_10580 [Halobiforma nitratireducens JCM 10879]
MLPDAFFEGSTRHWAVELETAGQSRVAESDGDSVVPVDGSGAGTTSTGQVAHRPFPPQLSRDETVPDTEALGHGGRPEASFRVRP